MKLISWNVNGLRACIQKGFLEQFDAFDADFFCLQETKLSEGQLQLELPGYEQYWCYAEKKGYSGTAIFAKHKPLSVHYGLDVPELDNEGRLITLEYPEFYLVTCYTPNAQRELARIDHRMKWDDAFRAYLARLDAVKPVILCGDLNVAHQEIDLKNPKSNRGSAGFSDQERESFGKTLDQGFTDTFRYLHPDARDSYTWWSYMFKAREKNAGWRIDYFLVSDRIRETVYRAQIHADILGSDHCPVSIESDLPCNGGIFSHSSLGKARDLTAPDDSTDTPRASAEKAKALAPFAALLAVILATVLLWNPIAGLFAQEATTAPTEETSGTPAYFTVHAYEDVPWSYAESLLSSYYSSPYADFFADETDSYYIPNTPREWFTDSNIALRIDLTQWALNMGLNEAEEVTVEFAPVTSIFDSTVPATYYFTAKYLSSSDRNQLGGWFILANIPGTRDYTVTVTWADYNISETQTLSLSPTGTDIPADLEAPMNITDLSGLGLEIYETLLGNSTVVTLGVDTYYSDAPELGDQLQNGVWWFLVEPSPQLTAALPQDLLFFSAHFTSSGNDTEGDRPIYGTLYYEPKIRTIYADPEHTQFLGWIVYAPLDYSGIVTLSLSWQSVGQYVTETVSHQVTPFSPDPDRYPTHQLLSRIVNDEYIDYQVASGDYTELWDITLLKWLAQREDCIATLMNYVPSPMDKCPSLCNGLLYCPEFRQLMTPQEEVLFLAGDYPGFRIDPWDLTLSADKDPGSYPTQDLAMYLLSNTSVHHWLLGECSDEQAQLAMLEYMLSKSVTLSDFVNRPDLWDAMAACRDFSEYNYSILCYIDLLVIPENPETMTTEQLVAAIRRNTALCDSIQDNGPDFENNALLKELATRDDAVEKLMNAPDPEDYSYLDIPYLLMSHPDIRRKMNPRQEADFITGQYYSCPYQQIIEPDDAENLYTIPAEDILYTVLAQGELSWMAGCSTSESAFYVFQFMYQRSMNLQEFVCRADAVDALERLLSTPTLADADKTVLSWLIEIWPRIESELCVPDMPYWE